MLRPYNPKECVVTINNSIALTGYSSSIMAGTKDNPFVSIVEGAQGDAVANMSASRLGTITITLQATSPSNAVLTTLAKSREIFKIWGANKPLGIRFGGNNAMVENYSTVELGETAGDRVYTIKVADYEDDTTSE